MINPWKDSKDFPLINWVNWNYVYPRSSTIPMSWKLSGLFFWPLSTSPTPQWMGGKTPHRGTCSSTQLLCVSIPVVCRFPTSSCVVPLYDRPTEPGWRRWYMCTGLYGMKVHQCICGRKETLGKFFNLIFEIQNHSDSSRVHAGLPSSGES